MPNSKLNAQPKAPATGRELLRSLTTTFFSAAAQLPPAEMARFENMARGAVPEDWPATADDLYRMTALIGMQFLQVTHLEVISKGDP